MWLEQRGECGERDKPHHQVRWYLFCESSIKFYGLMYTSRLRVHLRSDHKKPSNATKQISVKQFLKLNK